MCESTGVTTKQLAPSHESSAYSVCFDGGINVTFRPDVLGLGAVVKRSRERALRPGDVLMEANGINLLFLPFLEIMFLLRYIPLISHTLQSVVLTRDVWQAIYTYIHKETGS